jgi:hypothetical protein
MPHSPDRRAGRLRGRRSALPSIAGALRRSLLGLPRSVRRLPGPFPAVATPVSTCHRVSLPTRAGYSSRSQPVIRDVGGESRRGLARRQACPGRARTVGRPIGHSLTLTGGALREIRAPRTVQADRSTLGEGRARPESRAGTSWLSIPRRELGRIPCFVAGAREHRQLGVSRKSPIRSRKFAQHEPAALAAHDLPGVLAGGAEPAIAGGEGGIRTHGVLRLNGFQDRRIQPLCHLSAADCTAGSRQARMASVPIAGCRTSGTRIVPSRSWYVSRRAATVRARAIADPLRVWTSSGFAPGSGR